MKAGEITQIEQRTKELTEASSGLAQKMYAEQQAAGAGAGAGAGAAGAGATGNNANSGADDAVDAEFEEVKDDKDK
jgi:molecular chaperone DnaK